MSAPGLLTWIDAYVAAQDRAIRSVPAAEIAAKKRAVELRQPLRALIERGLRAELGRSTGHRPTKPRTIRWVTVAGGLPAGVDVSDRAAMHEWLRQQR